MTVEEITYNWHQLGSADDPCGMGEGYHKYKVGENGVVCITQHQDAQKGFNYLVTQEMEDGTIQRYRVFNPNHVTYKPINSNDCKSKDLKN